MGSKAAAAGSPVRWDCRNTLKPDWEEVIAEDGSTYYWNTITDETTWEEPRINQVVMVRTDRHSSPEQSSPEGRSFLNWRADDPTKSKRDSRPDSRPASPEPMLEEALHARADGQPFSGIKAKFVRVENDAMEEERIHARAMTTTDRMVQRAQIRELLRSGCISLGKMVQASARCVWPAYQEAQSPYDAHEFHADAQSACKTSAITVEALRKYQTAREMSSSHSPEQLTAQLLLASRRPEAQALSTYSSSNLAGGTGYSAGGTW